MGSVENFKIAQAKRQNSDQIELEDLMHLGLSYVNDGTLPPGTRALLLFFKPLPGSEEGFEIHSMRRALTRAEEIGFLEAYKQIAIDEWRHG